MTASGQGLRRHELQEEKGRGLSELFLLSGTHLQSLPLPWGCSLQPEKAELGNRGGRRTPSSSLLYGDLVQDSESKFLPYFDIEFRSLLMLIMYSFV